MWTRTSPSCEPHSVAGQSVAARHAVNAVHAAVAVAVVVEVVAVAVVAVVAPQPGFAVAVVVGMVGVVIVVAVTVAVAVTSLVLVVNTGCVSHAPTAGATPPLPTPPPAVAVAPAPAVAVPHAPHGCDHRDRCFTPPSTSRVVVCGRWRVPWAGWRCWWLLCCGVRGGGTRAAPWPVVTHFT